jgi:NIMA (never in mitosis gene a)-related kinase 1/4/5
LTKVVVPCGKYTFHQFSLTCISLVMEFAKSGDVYAEILRLQRETCFAEEEWAWKVLIQMVRGLKALHSLKILHRDIKTANIFLSDEKQTAKLGDMNVSKVAKRGMLSTQTGTPYYASPEVWRD